MSAGLVISRAILSILYLILCLKGSQCRLELFNFTVAELNLFPPVRNLAQVLCTVFIFKVVVSGRPKKSELHQSTPLVLKA